MDEIGCDVRKDVGKNLEWLESKMAKKTKESKGDS